MKNARGGAAGVSGANVAWPRVFPAMFAALGEQTLPFAQRPDDGRIPAMWNRRRGHIPATEVRAAAKSLPFKKTDIRQPERMRALARWRQCETFAWRMAFPDCFIARHETGCAKRVAANALCDAPAAGNSAAAHTHISMSATAKAARRSSLNGNGRRGQDGQR